MTLFMIEQPIHRSPTCSVSERVDKTSCGATLNTGSDLSNIVCCAYFIYDIALLASLLASATARWSNMVLSLFCGPTG